MTGPGASGEDDAGPGGPRCSEVSRASGEPMAGTAPRADVWVAVEHVPGWGDAGLARSEHGVRVVMARSPRDEPEAVAPPRQSTGSASVGSRDGSGAPAASGPVAGRGVRVWVGYATGTPSLRVGRTARPEDVGGWDLSDIAAGSMREWGRADHDPLLLVCANGRRDRCCGHAGGRLADALWRGPHRDRVLTCTHLGGHRFAPTALVLPFGYLHGRLDVSAATDLVAEARVGRMPATRLRGSSTLVEPAQVAEAHMRALTGYDGLVPLEVELLASEDPDRTRAAVRGPHSTTYSVDLLRRAFDVQPSCGRTPGPDRRWVIDH